ncbi:hypothetical protein ABZ714_09365 [Streptomyces sp. NPDC006798]|uniref:hypothetical protein n=1 Tax=Streptomyces sp. NPDC006798 TaxID=3155462 RepID=UPI0033DC979D
MTPAVALSAVRPREPGRLLLAGAVLSVGTGFAAATVTVVAAAGFSLGVQGAMRGRYDLPPGGTEVPAAQG